LKRKPKRGAADRPPGSPRRIAYVYVLFDSRAGAGRYVAAPYSVAGDPPAVFGADSGSTVQLSLYATLG